MTVMTTADAMRDFKKIMNEQSHKKIGDIKEIEAAIAGLKQTGSKSTRKDALLADFEQRSKALRDLTQLYMIAVLSQRYPAIDKGLFALQRNIAVEHGTGAIISDAAEAYQPDDKKKKFRSYKIPLFVYGELGGEKVPVFRKKSVHAWSRRVTTIWAKVPKAPDQIAALARRALSDYHHAVSKLYSMQDLDESFNANEAKAEVGIIWIPTTKQLSISVQVHQPPRSLDPALVLRVWGTNYLVATWDIDEEQPFRNYLREFTSGDLLQKLDAVRD